MKVRFECDKQLYIAIQNTLADQYGGFNSLEMDGAMVEGKPADNRPGSSFRNFWLVSFYVERPADFRSINEDVETR